ncbi:hypothetical protein BPORC_1785 [Bifidobacterium porcinum]|nr:hypothetical protein BPORC_1785 [Bifidobacterium porcinum]
MVDALACRTQSDDIVGIRVCQRHALCNRRGRWDIPESARLRAVTWRQEEDGPSGRWTVAVSCLRSTDAWGCSAAASPEQQYQ